MTKFVTDNRQQVYPPRGRATIWADPLCSDAGGQELVVVLRSHIHKPPEARRIVIEPDCASILKAQYSIREIGDADVKRRNELARLATSHICNRRLDNRLNGVRR